MGVESSTNLCHNHHQSPLSKQILIPSFFLVKEFPARSFKPIYLDTWVIILSANRAMMPTYGLALHYFYCLFYHLLVNPLFVSGATWLLV